MSDLISRQYVLDKFKALCDACGKGDKYNGVMCRCCYLDDGICIVEDAPSAEPERKTGEWLEKTALSNADYPIDEWQSAKCSVCGKYHTTPYMYSFNDYPYCPNCGSEMIL